MSNVYVLCPVIVVQKCVSFNYSRRRIRTSFSDSTGGEIKDGFQTVASCPSETTETDVVDARAFHPYTTYRCIVVVRYCAQMYTHTALQPTILCFAGRQRLSFAESTCQKQHSESVTKGSNRRSKEKNPWRLIARHATHSYDVTCANGRDD